MKKCCPLLMLGILLALASADTVCASRMKHVRLQIGMGLGSGVNGEIADDPVPTEYAELYKFYPAVRGAFEIGFCPALGAMLTVQFHSRPSSSDDWLTNGFVNYKFSGMHTFIATLGGRFRLPIEMDFDDWFETEYPEALGDFVPYIRYAYGLSFLFDEVTYEEEGLGEYTYWEEGQLVLFLEAAFGLEIAVDKDFHLFIELTYFLMMPPEVGDIFIVESSAMGSAALTAGFMFAF